LKRFPQALRRLSLTYRGKLILAIFFAGMLMNLFTAYKEMTSIKELVTERELSRITAVGQLLADDVTDDINTNNSVDLLEILNLSAAQKNVEFICATDAKNIVKYSTVTALINSVYTPIFSNDIFKGNKAYFVKSFPLVKAQYTNYPLMGYLHIGYSLNKPRADIKSALYRAALSNFLMLVGTLIIAWVISGVLIKPLSDMREVSKKISQGNFSERIRTRSPDIIGELASTLNMMAVQLGDLTDNLQNKISEKTRELEASNKKLLELDKLKSDFVSMVSHELRTPLTSIIGFSRTLLNLNLPEEKRKECLSIIESEGKRLAAMVEEFLDISKIEAGNFSLKMSTFNLADVVQESADVLEQRLAGRVEIAIPESLPKIQGDKERLQRVVVNLLDNAIKYSGKDEKIIISGKKSGSVVVIGIHDRGPGIPREAQGKLFEKFYRGSDEFAIKTRGSGLGLFIAKSIIDAHNGKIWVESELGRGAAFYFSVPMDYQTEVQNHEPL
jgi:signal transduction histidine kinase